MLDYRILDSYSQSALLTVSLLSCRQRVSQLPLNVFNLSDALVTRTVAIRQGRQDAVLVGAPTQDKTTQ
jgi:hypothetical protein